MVRPAPPDRCNEGASPPRVERGLPFGCAAHARRIVRDPGSRRMPVADPESRREAAREAGLQFSTDSRRGITRRRSGRGWTYRDRDGQVVRDPETLARIRSLAVPPAWTDVWICPN